MSTTEAVIPYHVRVEQAAETERVRREARRIVDAEDRPRDPLPNVRTLADVLADADDPVSWRIDGWLPAGARVLLAAQFKAGKTTMIGNLLRSLADGDPWLGDASVTQVAGTIALIDDEMSPRQLRAWLRDQGIAHPERIIPLCLRGRVSSLDLLDADRRREWVALLRLYGVRVLVLDCLRPVLDALGLDESHDAGRFLVALDALLREADIGECIVVHHMGHAGERSRGDSRLRDWPDAEWRLVRQDDSPHSPRFITAFGRDVDVRECSLSYDEATRRLTLSGGSRQDHRTHEALSAIVSHLHTCGEPQSGRAILAAFAEDERHTRKVIRDALDLGIRDGLIVTMPGPKRATLHAVRGAQ